MQSDAAESADEQISAANVWYDDEEGVNDDEYPIDQYDLTSSPNDFNILTIYSFIESGAIRIPGFQRNYVWDQKRASKLIESLIIGLPVPQIFLYEESRNTFLVIDGQQRLMSIYYFMKQRFPRKERRPELRRIFEREGKIPDSVLHDDQYFAKFNLSLPPRLPNQPNRFHNLNYSTLGEYKTVFDLRPIRNIIVKQVSLTEDDSAVYEIFNRLNSGGVNLTPQEIRMSLYHSYFYEMLVKANLFEKWRSFLTIPDPDLHVKDIEVLLRGFAMLERGSAYFESMVKFLNSYSKDAKRFSKIKVDYLHNLFESFLLSCDSLPDDAFLTLTKRFSVTIFESVFCAVCLNASENKELVWGKVSPDSIDLLRNDKTFIEAAQKGTTSRRNVALRLAQARDIIRLI